MEPGPVYSMAEADRELTKNEAISKLQRVRAAGAAMRKRTQERSSMVFAAVEVGGAAMLAGYVRKAHPDMAVIGDDPQTGETGYDTDEVVGFALVLGGVMGMFGAKNDEHAVNIGAGLLAGGLYRRGEAMGEKALRKDQEST